MNPSILEPEPTLPPWSIVAAGAPVGADPRLYYTRATSPTCPISSRSFGARLTVVSVHLAPDERGNI
ncbi:uncharacterized protein METZ01_LOCUS5750 [marine metagenome]|uniref:Uncharacterized protein n=1 Tax=marine metagenome TaxID=408172 RepID=A0A381NE80_9ZZZZ